MNVKVTPLFKAGTPVSRHFAAAILREARRAGHPIRRAFGRSWAIDAGAGYYMYILMD